MKPLGDRRAQVRFEVLGVLRGTLELIEAARIVNISAHGALVESPAKVALGSLQELHLTVDGQPARVSARVRRLQQIDAMHERYLIGLEFLSPPSTLIESIEQLSGNI
jgi:PilZ domain-containing protein